MSGYPLNRIQQTWNLIRQAADEASTLAHAPENRRNSTGTFEGGKAAGLEIALRTITEQYPDDLPALAADAADSDVSY